MVKRLRKSGNNLSFYFSVGGMKAHQLKEILQLRVFLKLVTLLLVLFLINIRQIDIIQLVAEFSKSECETQNHLFQIVHINDHHQ